MVQNSLITHNNLVFGCWGDVSYREATKNGLLFLHHTYWTKNVSQLTDCCSPEPLTPQGVEQRIFSWTGSICSQCTRVAVATLQLCTAQQKLGRRSLILFENVKNRLVGFLSEIEKVRLELSSQHRSQLWWNCEIKFKCLKKQEVWLFQSWK